MNVETENYVEMNLKSIGRSYTAQLRLGILPLNIEIGRYRAIPLANRICKMCTSNVVEDEHHFLFICSAYECLRKKQ